MKWISMKLIRITPDNVRYYIGYEIIFKTRGDHIIKKILDISKSCKSCLYDSSGFPDI